MPNINGVITFTATLSIVRKPKYFLGIKIHRAILGINWKLTSDYTDTSVVDVLTLDPSKSDKEKADEVNKRISEIAQEYPSCKITTEYAKNAPAETDNTNDTKHLLWSSDRLNIAMKLFKPLAISIILCWWYPPADTGMTGSGSNWCFLDFLSYIPNSIGSYTHDLYEAEATQIEDKFTEVQQLIYQRDTIYQSLQAKADVAHKGTEDPTVIQETLAATGVEEVTSMETNASKLWFTSLTAGAVVGLDKIIMLLALIVFRIGWWSTIYCQQILLGMLTIFGPIQWAFSLLPKWESSWAKWMTRYLTVHFYGACLYFVGFYVLLLFDIVLSIQVENLTAITASEQAMTAYLQNSFFSAGYLMAASIVALKCLNLVPDLAAWMIPDGDTAFSTRNFGEGVAQQAKQSTQGLIHSVMK